MGFQIKMITFFMIFILNAFCRRISDAAADADQLLLVQALWRHGDRSPLGTFKNDPNQEDAWPQGWGQLSPKGMAQQVRLGAKLKARYIDQLKFVNERYLSKEIYVRSTDLNRTLTSATANLIGFYSSGIAGRDFPSARQTEWWPHGFTPVAVHTIDSNEDHIIPDVPDVLCPRQTKILKMLTRTPEYRQLIERKKHLFAHLANVTGEDIDIFNFWLVSDTLFIEDLYRDQLLNAMPPWTQNKTLREEIKKMDCLFNKWINGKGIAAFNGVQFDIELPRIRGGPILWILIGNMQNKLNCFSPNPLVSTLKSPFQSPLCEWIEHKKYFAYSAHDTTIAALFSALGFPKTNYDVDGYPHYASCVTIELWRNGTDREPYIKALYWPPDLSGFMDITRNITGCATNATLAKFAQRSLIFKPMPSAEEYCKNTDFHHYPLAAKWAPNFNA